MTRRQRKGSRTTDMMLTLVKIKKIEAEDFRLVTWTQFVPLWDGYLAFTF